MFEVPQFFVGTDCTWALSELSADSSEEPTCRLRPIHNISPAYSSHLTKKWAKMTSTALQIAYSM